MHKHFPEELIEEIRLNNDIVDVVSEYVKLERKAKYYFGLCPFHNEKSPSFSVTPSKQIFYCYGCHKGGNVINFIKEIENLDYIEAVKYLADRAKIQLPEGESEEEKEKARLRDSLIKINTEAARFYYNELNTPGNEKAKQYLGNRRISPQTIKKFGLGYSPENWDSLYNHLKAKGFDDGLLLKSGLILPNKKGGYYDKFRGRIMFPIFDIRGNVIGFGGRVLDNSTPKYMNSPETFVYSKSRNLYALNFAKNSGQKRLLIVEGYMDVISLHQSGIINTTASLGTALTESQGRILKKYAEEIIIAYDADTAGQAATIRGLDLLHDIGCNVRVLTVPDGKDPDEFVKKHGKDEFVRLIDNAISLVEYKIRVLKRQINTTTTEGKISFLNRVAELLSKVDNGVEREIYVNKIAKEYEISEESIYSEIYKRLKPKNYFKPTAPAVKEAERKAGSAAADSKTDKSVYYERLILAFLCVDNSVYRHIVDKVSLDDFTDAQNRKAAEYVFERLEEKKGLVPAELMNVLEDSVANEFTRIIQEECNCEDNTKAVLDIIKRLDHIRLERRQQQILDLLNNRSASIEGDVEKLKLELRTIIMKIRSL